MFFFFKQKTAYEMRISDWSSDVCSSDLGSSFRWAADISLTEKGSCGSATICASSDAARSRISPASGPYSRTARTAGSGFSRKASAVFPARFPDRTSIVSGTRVYVRVRLGGGRLIKKNKQLQLH